MSTSRPLVEGDVVVAISLPLIVGETYLFNPRRMNPEHVVLCSDFYPNRGFNDWWEVVGTKVFGIANCTTSNDARLHNAIHRGTAPALYVREGDTVEPWSSYQAVLLERRLRALTERHQGVIAQLRLHGAGNIQLRVEDDVVVIRCLGGTGVLERLATEGVRIEVVDAVRGPLPNYAEMEAVITADLLRQYGQPLRGLNFPSNRYRATDQQRQMTERLAAAMNIPLDISAAELAEIDITPPPPPTRFNLLECDLPAVPPTRADQRLSDELAELQASFRAAKAARIAQPVLTRFDLLECDEPAVPVAARPQWSTQPSAQPHPQQPERRTVEDILDLTTSGPLEALVALQIVKAEIVRDLRQRETN